MTFHDWLLPQPPPVRTDASRSVTDALLPAVEQRATDRLARLLLEHRRLWRERHGTELLTHNGRDPRRDLLQRLLDALLYAQQDLMERPGPTQRRRVWRLEQEVIEIAIELESGER